MDRNILKKILIGLLIVSSLFIGIRISNVTPILNTTSSQATTEVLANSTSWPSSWCLDR